MDSPVFTIDDDEFLKEILAILADEDFALLSEEESSISVSVGGLLDAAIHADNADATSTFGLESLTSSTARGHKQEVTSIPLRNNQYEAFGDVSNVLLTTGIINEVIPTNQAQGRGRIHLREQLIQLRSVVRNMEIHLETLKSPALPRAGACTDREAHVARSKTWVDNGNKPLWRSIAMEQFRARRESELHNAQLRENLSAHIQLAERVNKLLQSQHSHSVL